MKGRTEKEMAIRKAYIDGFRPYVVQSPGTTYRGCFQKSENHGYGIKVYSRQKLVYDGQWRESKRDGIGTLRTIEDDGSSKRIYIGNWSKGKRCGEGKMFHSDGVYYGFWKDNKHHGNGIKWFDNGDVYIGQWKCGLFHGAGVMFYKNGNRYEGYFENGQKSGEGLYIHSNTGQVQKGVWLQDVCKTSIMFDEFRNQVANPTPYPILENKLCNPDEVVKQMFREYLPKITAKHKPKTSCDDIRMKIRLKFLANMFK